MQLCGRKFRTYAHYGDSCHLAVVKAFMVATNI